MTIHAELVCEQKDINDYTTYVFKNLDPAPFGRNYIMCTRFPNWIHSDINIGDIGYLSFIEVKAGVDTWYNGEHLVPYNYNNIIFINFIPDVTDTSKEIYI